MSMRRFDAQAPGFAEAFGKFLSLRRAQGSEDVYASASAIVRDVRARGGEAVAEYTRKFDRLAIDAGSLQADGINLQRLAVACPKDVQQALEFAAGRIEAYHAEQRPKDHSFDDGHGLELGWRWSAVDAVGVYVPGGRASYPSSVLMNVVPAKAAGVKRIVMVAPAPGGELNPAVAYAAVRAGVTEFYPIGGAQAVAALAYGAGQLKPVDKIVGPGNAWVAAAKRIVFGDVGIDTIAGPSEITVVADNQNDPAWIAADLMSQAEHDPLAQSILITDDADYAARVWAAAEAQIPTLSTAKATEESWRNFAAVVIAPLSQAAQIVNQIAPEHVELAVADPDAIAAGHSPFWRDLPWALGAGSAGGLCHRIQPRAAHVRRGALCIGIVGARFHEAHVCAAYLGGGLPLPRRRRRNAGRLRRSSRARAVCQHPQGRKMTETKRARIASIEIDEKSLAPAGPDADHERKVAIFDLIEDNSFRVIGHDGGPYSVVLSLADNRLVFDISEADGSPVRKLLLSLTALRRVIKDYFMICDSYYDAIRSATPSHIEAIDMGRRGLHNEGSQVLNRTAGRQGGGGFRHRPPAVHFGLRAARKKLIP